MRLGKSHLIVIGLVSLFGVALLFANTKASVSPETEKKLDLDKKITAAVDIINQGTESPMKGITMLREVLEEDPGNVKAHFQLGVFSIRSGQYDKALERFTKVLELEPNNTEVYYFLGHTYASLGNAPNAIENFEKYLNFTTDAEVKKEVNDYIKELKNL
jgi:Tfp pilus assembly protein PilF